MITAVKRAAAPVIIGAAVAAGVMGCTGNGHTASLQQHQLSASQSQQAKADARALAAKCIPTGATQQLEVASSLKSSSGRTAFMNKCGIPKSNKRQFESSLLSAVESGHLSQPASRELFFSVTLPKIIEENQG